MWRYPRAGVRRAAREVRSERTGYFIAVILRSAFYDVYSEYYAITAYTGAYA